MTSEMLRKLRRIFLTRYYVGLNDPSQSPTWNEICRSVGAERRDRPLDEPHVTPEGFVDIQDPGVMGNSSLVRYGILRMTEETAMKILALGDIP